MLQVTVEAVERPTQKHALASCRVVLSDGEDSVTVFDARVLRNKKTGELFVGFPQTKIRFFEPRWKYEPIIELSKGLKKRVTEGVLAAYNGPMGAEVRAAEGAGACDGR